MNYLRRGRTRMSLISSLSILLLAGAATAGQGQEKEMAQGSQETDQQEMMQAYMKAAQPGPEHERLAHGAGNWECTIRAWMDPSGEPMVSEGSEKAEMILGGRFLQSDFQGSTMGMPFKGTGLVGYDNVKKKYEGIWCDTMGTGIMYYEGEYDPQQDAVVCYGTYMDAVTGQEQKAKLVTRMMGDDKHVFEMWGPAPGSNQMVKMMEIEYVRAE
jgi:hypothetical protein